MTDPLIKLRKTAMKKAVNVNFRLSNMRRIEIDGQPENFDTFVQDISYSYGKIESTSFSVGNGELSFPQRKPVGSVVVTFRDDENNTVANFIDSLQKKIFNDDGTQNLPVDYLFELRVFRIKQDGEEFLEKSWKVYVEENHEFGGNDTEGEQPSTFNVTFKKYKSFGA